MLLSFCDVWRDSSMFMIWRRAINSARYENIKGGGPALPGPTKRLRVCPLPELPQCRRMWAVEMTHRDRFRFKKRKMNVWPGWRLRGPKISWRVCPPELSAGGGAAPCPSCVSLSYSARTDSYSCLARVAPTRAKKAWRVCTPRASGGAPLLSRLRLTSRQRPNRHI